MKKLISILLVFVMAAALLTVSVMADSDVPITLTGGWSAAESPEITAEVQELLDRAAEGLLGVDYTPVAYLGSQLVAGTNHCVLCQAKAVYPGAEPYYALVYIYEDLDGGVEVLDIQTLDIGEMMYRDAGLEIIDEDGQNPVMNFIGEYQCDRAHALVECSGQDGALITIDWGSSAWETARWVIEGPFDTDSLTVAYSGCVKSVLTYGEDGELESEEVEYEDGTGTIVFHDDGTFTWHDDQSENGEDMLFDWAPAADVEIPNPWMQVSEEDAKTVCPNSFAVPEGAENVEWSILGPAVDPEGVPGNLVEVMFDLYGMTFTAREQVTGDREADISGMYYEWTYEFDELLNNWGDGYMACKYTRSVGDGEWADLCAWYDEASGVSYSLSTVADDLDGFDLLAVVEAMAPPAA